MDIAACGELATAFADLRTGTSLRQVFVTAGHGRLELRSANAEARSFEILALSTSRRALRSTR